jgi:site-specific DNA-methyltransferase (adenine-specific)
MMTSSQPHPSRLIPDRLDGLRLAYQTELGQLYQGDMLALLRGLPGASIDMVFADPPFNLKKDYGAGVKDDMAERDYLDWSFTWLDECVRLLKPGASLFVFNLPRWCIEYGAHLNEKGLTFRHWIACRMPKSLPIPKRLSPAHYGLLYYTKGAPGVFNSVRVPIQTCRHCGGEVRDYGGHRNKLNPAGLNLMDYFDAPDEVWEDAPDALPPGQGWTLASDMWDDIPPVRHSRYKHRDANALAPIMLERLIALSTNQGDLVIDPFGGTGTTYYAAEHLNRRWLGVELGDVAPAIQRLEDHARGEHPRWESARGSARKNGAAIDKERAKRQADQPRLPFDMPTASRRRERR